MTPYFGKVKGQAETQLIKLEESCPSLRPYSLRPAMVDPKGHPEVLEATSGRKVSALMGMAEAFAGPVVRTLMPGSVSPTQPLGEFMVKLATGDGKPIEPKNGDVEMDGRILTNKAFRRLMAL